MEKSRDIHRVGSMHQYKIKMQDFGVFLDKDDSYAIGKKVLGIDSGRRDEDIIDYQKMSNPTQEDLKTSLHPTLSVGGPELEEGSALAKQSAMRLSSADPKHMRSSVRRQVVSSKK